jgi:hypothetical protein
VLTSSAIALTSTTPGISNASSPDFTTNAVGVYHWVAAYTPASGSPYKASTSNCANEAVTTTTAPTPTPTPTPSGNGGVQAITTTTPSTPGTGSTGSLTGITVGGFLLLGGLGFALMGVLVPRRRRSQ